MPVYFDRATPGLGVVMVYDFGTFADARLYNIEAATARDTSTIAATYTNTGTGTASPPA